MKTRILMFISLMLCTVTFMMADTPGAPWPFIHYIESGTKWEMEVQSKINPDEEPFQVTEWLEGPVQIGDKNYLELWVQIGDEAPEMKTYLWFAMTNSRIYAVDPDDMERERLVYKMSVNNFDHDTEPLAILNWDGTVSEEEYSFRTKYGDSFQNSGYNWWNIDVNLYPLGAEKIEENCLGKVEWIWGLGGMHGFTNQLYSLCDDYETTLKRVITSCSGIVYDANQAGIGGINADDSEGIGNNVKYHIDGTLFREGDKGIYIMNGKKYIAR